MSAPLDKARQQFDSGKHKAAVATLWGAEAELRGSDDLEGALCLLDLASKLREVTKGGLRGQCDELVRSAQKVGYRARALAVIPECTLVGGSGFAIERPSEGTWDLIFKDDQVLVHQVVGEVDAQTLAVGWGGLSIDIDVARLKRRRTVWIGLDPVSFGVGLAASALSAAYAHGTDPHTVIRLRTPSGELYLHVATTTTPQGVRQTLLPVLVKIGQQPDD